MFIHIDRDMKLILQSLVCFAFVLCIGLSITEKQVNTLTQQRAVILSTAREYDGHYSLILFGRSYQAQSVVELGSIKIVQRDLMITVCGNTVTIPTLIYFDLNQLLSEKQIREFQTGVKYMLQLFYSR